MDDRPTEDGDEPDIRGANSDAGTTEPDIDAIPGGPEARALEAEAEEIRGLVDAGAGSPEALRELAARLREHRAREEALWKTEVKPALVKENKGRLRGHRRSEPIERERTPSNLPALALVLLGLLGVVAVAASTSFWTLVVPLVGLLAWAWHQGRTPPE
ncbi:MAG: hypothetical protein ACT4OV_06050 [Microthrixaceae bacterium]